MEKIANVLLLVVILSMLGLYIINEVPQKAALKIENKNLSIKVDSLLAAKQKITIQIDTIRDTIKIKELIPYKTVDSLINDSVKSVNFYSDVVGDTNISIEYKAIIFGTLQSLELNYTYKNKTTTIENILYVDKPFKIEVFKPKRELFLYTDFGYSDLHRLYYGVELQYISKKRVGYKAGYHRIGNNSIYSTGVGINLF